VSKAKYVTYFVLEDVLQDGHIAIFKGSLENDDVLVNLVGKEGSS
jgi:hypothetical protein